MQKLKQEAQTAVEYMLLLATVVAIALIALKTYIPDMQATGNLYYDRTVTGIVGDPNPCGDGRCNAQFESLATCCVDCGGC